MSRKTVQQMDCRSCWYWSRKRRRYISCFCREFFVPLVGPCRFFSTFLEWRSLCICTRVSDVFQNTMTTQCTPPLTLNVGCDTPTPPSYSELEFSRGLVDDLSWPLTVFRASDADSLISTERTGDTWVSPQCCEAHEHQDSLQTHRQGETRGKDVHDMQEIRVFQPEQDVSGYGQSHCAGVGLWKNDSESRLIGRKRKTYKRERW